MEQRS